MHSYFQTQRSTLASNQTRDLAANHHQFSDSDLLLRVIDEIDYGLCVLTHNGVIEHANRIALDAMTDGRALVLRGTCIDAREHTDRAALLAAIQGAFAGRRSMLLLGKANEEVSVALTPLGRGQNVNGAGALEGCARCLLVMGKTQSFEPLSLAFFARAHGLTPAESVVLGKLSCGHSPKDIARTLGVAVATVRTQIGSIRSKTRTESIRDLARRIAALPPVTLLLKPRVLN